MGLFQQKKEPNKKAENPDDVEHFFDEYFREELRNRGRWYFEKVIKENGALFKQDLDATVTQVNVELKEHVTKQLEAAVAQVNVDLKEHAIKQLDGQFAEHTKAMKEAQDLALKSITESAHTLKSQHDELKKVLERNVTDQQNLLHATFDENKTQIEAMKDAQESALRWLNQSAQALHEQYQKISTTLDKNIAQQEQMMVSSFQDNMARVIEHHLLGAMGDQYDLKAQVPAIIQQMEDNKQTIVDDMKL